MMTKDEVERVIVYYDKSSRQILMFNFQWGIISSLFDEELSRRYNHNFCMTNILSS